jgi:Fur family ferric uptake transcriptional regulator
MIVDALARMPGHFTVDALAAQVRSRGRTASRATVYRAIPLLLEAGLVVATGRPGEQQMFEAGFGQQHHDHLICQRCGKVVEFELEAIEILQRSVAERHGFELVGHRHELHGICPECQQARAGSLGRARSGKRRPRRMRP